MPGVLPGLPIWRTASPSGASTLITSAPWSASSMVPYGPRMMLVRSTILMPSSAPGIVLSCAGRGRETAIALTWRHAIGNCDAKLGGNHGRAHPDAQCRALQRTPRGGRGWRPAPHLRHGLGVRVRLANGLLALGLEGQDRVGVLEGKTVGSAGLLLGAAIS